METLASLKAHSEMWSYSVNTGPKAVKLVSSQIQLNHGLLQEMLQKLDKLMSEFEDRGCQVQK